MKSINSLQQITHFGNKTVEEQIELLPLYVCNIDDPLTKYNFSLFRHSDGEYVATYENFDAGINLCQVNDTNLNKCLTKLYSQIIGEENLVFGIK